MTGASRGTIFFAIFALAVSAGCVRLGFWQLSRLDQRRARNADVRGTMALPPVTLAAITRDSALRFRRASAEGRYDYENEFVLTSRARSGAPGVYLITPLRTSEGAILVNRGWVYAPDGMRIDRGEWREDSVGRVEGYIELFATEQDVPVSTPSVPRGVRRLDRDSIVARLPYPVASAVIVQQIDSGVAAAAARGTPVRVEPAPLDDGPHRAYAIQWFAFAAVGVVGTVYVLTRQRNQSTD